jgi:hypothetical protein
VITRVGNITVSFGAEAMPAKLRKLAVTPVPLVKPGLPALPASVETIDEDEPGGVMALTAKTSTPEITSLPVVVVTVRGPNAAVGEIVIFAVALVALLTVTELTVISPPKEAVVWLLTQLVPVPVNVVVNVWPCVPLAGLTVNDP